MPKIAKMNAKEAIIAVLKNYKKVPIADIATLASAYSDLTPEYIRVQVNFMKQQNILAREKNRNGKWIYKLNS